MSFQKNHFIHFLITLGVIFLLASVIIHRQNNLNTDSLDLNRKISGKLILSALDKYKVNMGIYPDKIEDLSNFIQPIPVDPSTGKPFAYQKKSDTSFELIIPQTKNDDIIFTNTND